jgi:hypothetical protein
MALSRVTQRHRNYTTHRYTASCAGQRLGELSWSGIARDEYSFAMVATSGFCMSIWRELGQAIDRRARCAGDRLPSVRRFAQERASAFNGARAYAAENAGLDRGPAKSGTSLRRRSALTAEPRRPRAGSTPSRVTVGRV